MYPLTTKQLFASLFGVRNTAMNALQRDKAKAPVKPTGKKPTVEEMLDRAMTRWPKTMARLAE